MRPATERDLEIEVMKEVAAKTGERAGSPQTGGLWPGAGSVDAAGLHAIPGGGISAGLSKPAGGVECSGDPAEAEAPCR
jgi:hypothetical protein